MESVSDLPAKRPPNFGHDVLKYFMFDPSYTNLNHGSYGALPKPVFASSNSLTESIEENPDVFTKITMFPQLTAVRQRLAALVSVPEDTLVIVRNTSLGLNTVLRNIEWTADDVIVVFSTTYDAINRIALYLSDRPPHPRISTFELRLPCLNEVILTGYREHLRALRNEVGPDQRIVAIVDSHISNPGVYLPWRELVQICKKVRAISVIDGAHSIGQEVNLQLESADPDFFVSSCHKWLYAKRSCGFIYVPKRNQHYIKSAIPTPWSYLSPDERAKDPSNFITQFDYNGTIDMVPYLSVIPALDFRQWLGGELCINEYCHSLALHGSDRLAELLKTEVMDKTGEQTLNMTNVMLPLPHYITPSGRGDWISDKFEKRLLVERKISCGILYHNGRWWARCSAQIYNELSDFERLADVLKEVCEEIVEEWNNKRNDI